jgi:hypothetical protein
VTFFLAKSYVDIGNDKGEFVTVLARDEETGLTGFGQAYCPDEINQAEGEAFQMALADLKRLQQAAADKEAQHEAEVAALNTKYADLQAEISALKARFEAHLRQISPGSRGQLATVPMYARDIGE